MQRTNQFSVLLVTKDLGMAKVLKTFLENDYFCLYRTATGDETLQLLTTWKPDIIILDIVLPDLDGWEVLTQIKEKMDVPIIVVGENGKESERPKALAAGADDYLLKPFSCRDIEERAKVILRQETSKPKPSEIFQAGDLAINLENFQVTYKGRDITLTLTEFRILGMLVLHSEQTLNRADIIEMIWGKNLKGTTRSIDAHIHSLRRKLAKNMGEHEFIQTVHGVGYRFASANKLRDSTSGIL
ncbi:response regulator transcription factor [Sporomusa malonica]|uniref:DNA-binding response regulator, OmpR family, contains REC and winged-helix (WHTH) domain n=1 Tax=Sporomusa malonica TaxID=112901 RepID=A0A1W1Z5Q7_9FIRM|nr:response regulator transcription factor [Sporomusa malonica]SMC43632.1 DNA-binding response regulator, OmpR family, contains REC and winged-helix (wHTH) domain [Sporomusa malonica]